MDYRAAKHKGMSLGNFSFGWKKGYQYLEKSIETHGILHFLPLSFISHEVCGAKLWETCLSIKLFLMSI